MSSEELAAVQARLRRFGEAECRGHAPLYEQLSNAASQDPEVAGLLEAPPAQRRGTTFFAAVHYSLLRDPDHALATFYPSTGGDPASGDAYPSFRAFCAEREHELRQILASRATQTNEVRRCATLLPALAPIAPEIVGPVLPPVPDRMPIIASRIGVDLTPVDLTYPDARLWLRACVWAEHLERAALLEAAISMASRAPPRVIAADLFDVLPELVNAADRGTTICVMSSNVLPYLTPEQRGDLLALLDAAAIECELFWISSEGIDFRFPWIAAPPTQPADPYAMAVHRSRFHAGDRSGEQLAYAHPHGSWLQWVATEPWVAAEH